MTSRAPQPSRGSSRGSSAGPRRGASRGGPRSSDRSQGPGGGSYPTGPRPSRRSGPRPGGKAAGKPSGDRPDADEGKVRLQRVLAAAGIAARRVCETLITEGRVEVNGKIVKTLPAFVDPRRDSITVDGRTLQRPRSSARAQTDPLSGQRRIYIVVNKPEKVLCTTRDEAGRPTIMDMVHHPAVASPENPLGARIYPVGRLDFHTSGLVLMTNDGELANRLTHAKYGIPKVYRVSARPALDDGFLADLAAGLNRKHARALEETGRSSRPAPSADGPIWVQLVSREQGKTTMDISLTESGPMSIADMLREAGLRVVKVVRTGIGPLQLRGVGLGQWREVEREELRALREAARL